MWAVLSIIYSVHKTLLYTFSLKLERFFIYSIRIMYPINMKYTWHELSSYSSRPARANYDINAHIRYVLCQLAWCLFEPWKSRPASWPNRSRWTTSHTRIGHPKKEANEWITEKVISTSYIVWPDCIRFERLKKCFDKYK